jgi:hypothetical protein
MHPSEEFVILCHEMVIQKLLLVVALVQNTANVAASGLVFVAVLRFMCSVHRDPERKRIPLLISRLGSALLSPSRFVLPGKNAT